MKRGGGNIEKKSFVDLLPQKHDNSRNENHVLLIVNDKRNEIIE